MIAAQKKDREDEDSGVLGRERKARGQSDENQTPRRRSLRIAIERIHRGQQKASQPRVGGDKGAVRQLVWVEHQQDQRDEACLRAEHFLPRKKHEQREKHGQDGSGHACAEEHCVSVIFEEKLLAAEERFDLEIAILECRYSQWHLEYR